MSHPEAVTVREVGGKGNRLVTVGSDDILRVWDIEKARLTREIWPTGELPRGTGEFLKPGRALSPDGTWFEWRHRMSRL